MRVNFVNKASPKALRDGEPRWRCGACGKPIMPGDPYRWAKGRYTARKIRCANHHFSRADLCDSKLAQVYEAFDNAYAALGELDPETDLDSLAEQLETIVIDLATAAREVADEYEEAAAAFNYNGPNQEKAEEVGACADEIESIYIDPDDDEEYGETLIDRVRSEIESADTL